METFKASSLEFECQLANKCRELSMPAYLLPFAQKGYEDGLAWKEQYSSLLFEVEKKKRIFSSKKKKYDKTDLQHICKELFNKFDKSLDYSAHNTIYFSHFIKAVDHELYDIFGRFIEFSLAGSVFIERSNLSASVKIDLATMALNKIINKSSFFSNNDYYVVAGYKRRYTIRHKYTYFIAMLNSYIFTSSCMIFHKGFENYKQYISKAPEKSKDSNSLLELKTMFVRNNILTKHSTFPMISPFVRKGNNEGGFLIYELFNDKAYGVNLDPKKLAYIQSLGINSLKNIEYINHQGILFLSFDLEDCNLYSSELEEDSIELDDLKHLNVI